MPSASAALAALLLTGGVLIALPLAAAALIALPRLIAALALPLALPLSLLLLAILLLLGSAALPLPLLLLAAASQALQAIPHLFKLCQRLLVVVTTGGVPAESALRFTQLVAKVVQALRDGVLPRKHVGSVATPEEIGVVLHSLVQLVLLRVAKRATHLR